MNKTEERAIILVRAFCACGSCAFARRGPGWTLLCVGSGLVLGWGCRGFTWPRFGAVRARGFCVGVGLFEVGVLFSRSMIWAVPVGACDFLQGLLGWRRRCVLFYAWFLEF